MKLRDRPPAPEHDHAIAQEGQILVLGGREQDRGTGGCGVADATEDLRPRADVDSLGRLMKEEYLGVRLELFGEKNLLLVAAAEGREHPVGVAWPDVVLGEDVLDGGVLSAEA